MDQTSYRYEHVEYRVSPHAHFRLFENDVGFVSPHWHDALELIRLLDGELVVILNGHETLYRAGDIILINSRVLHATASRTGNSSILLQIPEKDLYHYIPDMREKQFVWTPFSRDPEVADKMQSIRELMDRMRQTAIEQPPGHILRFESLILELIFQLYNGFARGISREDHPLSERSLERLGMVFAYTEQHYMEPIALTDIAEELHLQVNYFCRFFKENTGQTYLNYLRDFRLYKIYHDLITTDMPVSALAERHGFTNEKLFRQSFLERFGETPGALRRNMQSKRS